MFPRLLQSCDPVSFHLITLVPFPCIRDMYCVMACIYSGWLKLRITAISSASASETIIKIPQFLESVETLEFHGFTNSVTREILNSFERILPNFQWQD